ncbi:hypothetical protein AVEN_56863-1 [Araneus ventricosus]|uniref:Uncharacterized protein n=1 Tax=Araneus ventricosus TaxID=182803 RepID=A0A4Y2C190_ARAVE|nr:hypothetical protein AVEN_56863-1 [Araneus ventricosus]
MSRSPLKLRGSYFAYLIIRPTWCRVQHPLRPGLSKLLARPGNRMGRKRITPARQEYGRPSHHAISRANQEHTQRNGGFIQTTLKLQVPPSNRGGI